jgi:hypothetical protein
MRASELGLIVLAPGGGVTVYADGRAGCPDAADAERPRVCRRRGGRPSVSSARINSRVGWPDDDRGAAVAVMVGLPQNNASTRAGGGSQQSGP